MTADEAIAIVYSKARGRTRYEGQEPFLDEVLVAKIERLRVLLDDTITKANEIIHWHQGY